MLLCLVFSCLLASVHPYSVSRHRRQTNFGGGSRQGDELGQAEQPSTDTRFFFGNTGLLGNLFGGNECACSRRRRQAEIDTKFLFGGGNSGCNCPSPTSAENDCKGRPDGDTFYGCGCTVGGGEQGGGLFGFGRRRRQTSKQKENVNTKFLDFRCIGATILGRKAT
eukprot:GFUD01100577.1.p1 GENE.GFUD01100577.1~~GFUD01100577.1.p1  ORF type:complete len:166 (+),score=41.77 GFUD01100577.1:70-567(+)